MAILPHKIELEYTSKNHLDEIVEWCQSQWPYTHGATWTWYPLGSVILTYEEAKARLASGKRFSKEMVRLTFQFESDCLLLRMRWC